MTGGSRTMRGRGAGGPMQAPAGSPVAGTEVAPRAAPLVRCRSARRPHPRRIHGVSDAQRTSRPCCPRTGCSRRRQAFRTAPSSTDPSIYERAAADPEAFWAEQADRLAWSRRWDTVMEWTAALGQLVRRAGAERLVQLPGPSRRGRRRRQGRLPLGGRARRRADDHVRASCWTRCAGSRTPCGRSASARATA